MTSFFKMNDCSPNPASRSNSSPPSVWTVEISCGTDHQIIGPSRAAWIVFLTGHWLQTAVSCWRWGRVQVQDWMPRSCTGRTGWAVLEGPGQWSVWLRQPPGLCPVSTLLTTDIIHQPALRARTECVSTTARTVKIRKQVSSTTELSNWSLIN